MTGVTRDHTLATTDDALRRLYERCLLLALIAVIVWALLDKAWDMRSEAELSAFRSSLGSLRVALVLERINSTLKGDSAGGQAVRNPFQLLVFSPGSYAGEVAVAAAESGAVVPGSWFFDARCPCVGYRPRDDRRFIARSGSTLMVFLLAAPGMLMPREPYVWRGEIIN